MRQSFSTVRVSCQEVGPVAVATGAGIPVPIDISMSQENESGCKEKSD